MWRRMKRQATSGLAALLLVGMVGCVDLAVENPNAPDRARALGTAGDVESLIAGAFLSWSGVLYYSGPTMALSAAAYEHSAPWANSGVEFYARIPRVPTDNVAGGSQVLNLTYGWTRSYRAIAAVAAGLGSVDDGSVTLEEETRARAYGRFVQGLAHATVAALYDSGFVYDESISPTDVTLVGYQDVMTAALGYLAEAATLANSETFTIPSGWMGADVSNTELAKLAHSAAAVFRANVARSPAERKAVDWNQVVADANAGVTEDWHYVNDCITFCDEALYYRNYPGWSMQTPFIFGMADQSGGYQAWMSTPVVDRREFLVVTPDTRYPQGADEATQIDNDGSQFAVATGSDRLVGKRPDRGTWRWSFYWMAPVFYDMARNFEGDAPLFTVEELKGLIAEAPYQMTGATDQFVGFINSTRTLHGLAATDAAGTNTDCVPKLPNGTCGNLLEMFKWEKRLETQMRSPLRIGWYLDARGWGDLTEGTLLNFAVPYGEMQILGRQPYNTGGVGGYEAFVGTGTYGFPGP